MEKQDEQGAESEDRQAGYAQSHDHAACEADLQAFAQAGASRLCCADVGLCRDAHSDVTGQCGEDRTNDESDNDKPVGGFDHAGHQTEQCSGDYHEDGEDAVLRAKEGEGAFVNVVGDFSHSGFAGVLLANPSSLHGHDEQSQDGDCRY